MAQYYVLCTEPHTRTSAVSAIDGRGNVLSRCALEGDSDSFFELTATHSRAYLCTVGLTQKLLHIVSVSGAGNSELTVTQVDVSALGDVMGCSGISGSANDVLVSAARGLLRVDCREGTVSQHTSQSPRRGPHLPGPVVAPSSSIAVSAEWASAQHCLAGCHPRHLANYGSMLHVWRLTGPPQDSLVARCDLGPEGVAPVALCLREPPRSDVLVCGYTACCPSTAVFYFECSSGGKAHAEKVIHIPQKTLPGTLQAVQGMSLGMCLSPSGTSLFLSQWLHGDVRMYDVTNPTSPVLLARLQKPSPWPAKLRMSHGNIAVTTGFFASWFDQFSDGVPAASPLWLVAPVDDPAAAAALEIKQSVTLPRALCLDVVTAPQ